MADAPRRPTGAKNRNDDHAALTLLDAAFCMDAPERERLVRAALARDEDLRVWATHWAAERCGDADVVESVASALLSFFESLSPVKPTKRLKSQGATLPLTDAWRTRLASIAVRLSESAAISARFDDELASAKLDALKEFAYGAGHEINNPLANISARAQTLLRDESHAERRRMLATINRQAMRAHEMIADLMLFARPPRLERSEVDAAAIVRRVVEELATVAAAQATTLVFREPQAPLLANVDHVQIAVAVKAVVRNAIEAVAAGGSVDVAARIVHAAEVLSSDNVGDSASQFRRRMPVRPKLIDADMQSRLVEISVHDNGPGFSAREQAHLFDPFFSGREAGRGLGFGLCLAWRIVTDHGGQIAVMSEPGRGTTVVMALAAEAAAQPA